jgi:UDP-N-acetylglucosamine:LPS N-acetylglucosamine transferase
MVEAVALSKDEQRLERLKANIAKLAIADAAERVVREIENELAATR